jgi:hypothetical protein
MLLTAKVHEKEMIEQFSAQPGFKHPEFEIDFFASIDAI